MLQEQKTEYWNKALASMGNTTDIIADYAFESAKITYRDSCEFDATLPNCTKRESHIDMDIAFFASIYAILLSRFSGQKNIVFGLETGEFQNQNRVTELRHFQVVPIIIDLNKVYHFCDLVKHIRGQIALNRNLSMTQDEFNEIRINESGCFFDALMCYSDLEDHFVSQVVNARKSEFKENIVLSIQKQNHLTIKGSLNFNSNRYTQKSIEKLCGHFVTLVDSGFNHNKHHPLKLKIMAEEEYQLVVNTWNDRSKWQKQSKCLFELIDQQALLAPNAIALEYGEKRMTYIQLTRRNTLFADYLVTRGVKKGDRVALLLPRSFEMIIAIIAIMKAGASYVPIDVSYPKSRLSYLTQNSKVSLVITDGKTDLHFLKKNYPILNIAKEKRDIFDDREVVDLPQINGNDPAYLIYTSGSSGKPKGVVVTHFTAANYIVNHNIFANVESTDSQLQFASVSFDVSLMEIFSPLVAGGRCVVMDEPSSITMRELTKIIESHRTNSVFVPPTYWVSWMEYLFQCNKRIPTCIKRLYIGADKVEPYMIDLWKKTCDINVELLNGYGPTEATVCASVLKFRIDKLNQYVKTGRVPIGTAIGNTRIFILDEFLNPVPIGAPGEIYIGGEVLAKEYFDEPELTAKMFIDNPFEYYEKRIEKMYKTGDLARFLHCGNIEFLGRRDDQVKVNGFRIELGEIENTLIQFDEVSEVAVLVITNSDNKGKFIAAYIVTNEKSITRTQIGRRLEQILPHYMVPSKVFFLDELPKTPNGKLDKSHLKALELSTGAESKASGLLNKPERLVAEIWSEVLQVDILSLDKNSDFIESGGNSIKFIVVVTLICEKLDKDIDFLSLIEQPTATIEEFANLVNMSMVKA